MTEAMTTKTWQRDEDFMCTGFDGKFLCSRRYSKVSSFSRLAKADQIHLA